MSLNAPNLLHTQRFNTQFSDTQIAGLKSKPTVEVTLRKDTKSEFPYRTKYHNIIDMKTINTGESCTDLSFLPECDLKSIVARYTNAGLPIPVPDKNSFGNIISEGDLGQTVRNVQSLSTAFNQLPAKLKTEFNNDYIQFAEFCRSSSDVEYQTLMDKYNLGEQSRVLQSKSAARGEQVVPEGFKEQYVDYVNQLSKSDVLPPSTGSNVAGNPVSGAVATDNVNTQ